MRPKEVQLDDAHNLDKGQEIADITTKVIHNDRDKRLCNGVYIKGQIEGIPILFTADTGASRTVISERVYNRMIDGKRPALSKTSCLVGADGAPIREMGKAMFNMQLGPLVMAREAVCSSDRRRCAVGGTTFSWWGKMGRLIFC